MTPGRENNAGGRVGLPDAGARLLSSSDPLESLELAKILDANNSTRKEIEALVLEEAILQVEKNNLEDSVLVVSGQNWHPGVIGIIAARLKEKYNRPACVISLIGDSGKGSARSVPLRLCTAAHLPVPGCNTNVTELHLKLPPGYSFVRPTSD